MGDARNRQFPPIPTALPRIRVNAINNAIWRTVFLARLNALSRCNNERFHSIHCVLAQGGQAINCLALAC